MPQQRVRRRRTTLHKAAKKLRVEFTLQESKPSVKEEIKNVSKSDYAAVVGEVAKDVEVKDGKLYINNINIGKNNVNIVTSIEDELQVRAKLPKNAITVLPITKIGNCYLLIFENMIITGKIMPGQKTMNMMVALVDDSSKIFTHSGAIFLAKDSSIIATTPTTLLIIMPTKAVSRTYKSMFGAIPPLQKPVFDNDENGLIRGRIRR